MAKPSVLLCQSELSKLVEERLEFWSTNEPVLVLVKNTERMHYIFFFFHLEKLNETSAYKVNYSKQ